MFLSVTVRFRFGVIIYSVGAPERYSHICVFKYIGTLATECEYFLGYFISDSVIVSVTVVSVL
jgi:hypothetical protein